MAGRASERLLIDTDIGTDDAVAILMALRHPGVRVEALTTVSGNIDVDQCVRNASYLLELIGQRVPVYRGAEWPLMREHQNAAHVHGGDGLGDLGLRPERVQVEPGIAAQVLVERILAAPGEMTLVTLGPLTNIALALSLAPRIAQAVKRVVVMGGAANTAGNVTPAAEFNIWADPEAARIVVRSGMPLTLVPIEICRGAYAHDAHDQERLAAIATPLSQFVLAMCRGVRDRARRGPEAESAGLPDAVAMAVALEPAILSESGEFYVDVETEGQLTAGETVVDRLGVLRRPANMRVGLAIDAARYKQMLRTACGEAP